MSSFRFLPFIILCFSLAPLLAQNGDVAGETQPPVSADLKVPPAPVLSPSEALAAFTVEPGFRVELVAAEPLLEDPVAAAFDHQGRLWVVEMRGYMPDAEGFGEDQDTGRIVVLEDLDGDGRMDRSTPFVEDLVLPRALAIVGEYVLVVEPPYLRWYRDLDGDLEWDEDGVVSSAFGISNPEHGANGLLRAMDNWIYLARYPVRLRRHDGTWCLGPAVGPGQWGLAQDDHGRLFYNYNSDFLRCDLVPQSLAIGNPNLGRAAGINHGVVKDQRVWPVRVTPGVNRGYRKQTLREDGTLRHCTAVCGPVIYRGDLFPASHRGNAFICEPAGNLIKREVLEERDGRVHGKPAYEGQEFLASRDERFRPVNMINGPDGALYVVDLYRGLIQHRTYLTTFLRRQVDERGLARPTGLGRIWRIVPDSPPPRTRTTLDPEDAPALVAALAHENGFWRSRAQELLVDGRRMEARPALRLLARHGVSAAARRHALWTMDGLDHRPASVLLGALEDRDPGVRIAALRILPRSEISAAVIADHLRRRLGDEDVGVRRQLLMTAGRIAGPAGLRLLRDALVADSRRKDHRDAALSGLYRRELALARALLEDARFDVERPGRAALLNTISRCLTRDRETAGLQELLTLAAGERPPWQSRAILAGIAGTRPPAPKPARALRLAAESSALGALARHEDASVAKAAAAVTRFTTWPGHASWEQMRLRPLTTEEAECFERGRRLYTIHCAGCHQGSGHGFAGLAPPLRGSEWVEGAPERLVRIVRHGLQGPIEVAGRSYDLTMPAINGLASDELSAILTFVRRAWDNEGDPVTTDFVEDVDVATKSRDRAWSAEELKKLP